MVEVIAITSGQDVPTARFRIRQHINPLAEYGVNVTERRARIEKYAPVPGLPRQIRARYILPLFGIWKLFQSLARISDVLESHHYMITWLERDLISGLPTFDRWLNTPLVLDVDDAIWLEPPLGGANARANARRAEMVIAGNTFLADWLSNYTENITIIPTAIDAQQFIPIDDDIYLQSEEFVIGWIGTSGNLPYLYAIENALHTFLSERPDARLHIVSNAPPKFKKINAEQVRFICWSQTAEVESIQEMTVGLMPLPDTDWARGKCSFKMLQYMSCGLPVVVSPIGMNIDVLHKGRVGLAARTNSEWIDALVTLYQDRQRSREYGLTGRKVILQHYERQIIAERISKVFLNLPNR